MCKGSLGESGLSADDTNTHNTSQASSQNADSINMSTAADRDASADVRATTNCIDPVVVLVFFRKVSGIL